MLSFLWGGDGTAAEHPAANAAATMAPPVAADPELAAPPGLVGADGVPALAGPVRQRLAPLRPGSGHRSKLASQLYVHRARRATAEASIVRLADASAPSMQQHIADTFSPGEAAAADASHRRVKARMLRRPGHVFSLDKRQSHSRYREYALSWHTRLVRERLKDCVDGASVLICSAVCDDATMWCRLPPDQTAKAAAERRFSLRVRAAAVTGRKVRRPGKQISASGRSKASTCQSLVQQLYVKRAGSSPTAIEIVSPCVTVPQANWRTLQHRKHRWLTWTGNAVGEVYRGDTRANNDAFNSVPAIVMLSTNDAASTNRNIRAVEEMNCKNATSSVDERWRIHYDIHCLGHQIVLPTRAAGDMCSNLPTILVRLAHILSTSTQATKFCEALDGEVAQHYDHREVLELPCDPQYLLSRRRARFMLEKSMVSMDFDKCILEDVYTFFNGKWDTVAITHFCLAGQCPFRCRSAADGRQRAQRMVRLAVGQTPAVPLAYRWKGMERAAGWALRARGLHEIGIRSLKRMWSKKDLLQAAADAERAKTVGELSFQTRTALNASSVLQFAELDKENMQLVKFHLVTGPLQAFLSQVQAVDKSVCSSVIEMQFQPDGERARELRADCIQRNHAFISTKMRSM